MNKFIIEFPRMSWEKPIEEEILSFTKSMANQFEQTSLRHKETGWFANNSFSNDCATMAKAYRTVEEHIEKEIELRRYINDSKLTGKEEGK